MKQHRDNPPGNNLGQGLTEGDLQKAIEVSGYPLQSVVVDTVLDVFSAKRFRCQVQEEWSFIDQDQGTVRQLDALISCELKDQTAEVEFGRPSKPSGHFFHLADLLVECKQSDLPYVFFIRNSDAGQTPRLAGLPHSDLEIRGNGTGFYVPMTDVLGLYELPFRDEPPTAISMSRIYRKGKSLELSGDEAFRSLSLPLTKAFHHFLRTVQSSPSALFFNIRTVYPVAVLRAPMVGVWMDSGTLKMQSLPWVRLVRTEPGEADLSTSRGFSEVTSFDVVHVEFLTTYVQRILETAQEVARRVTEFALPMITGQALVSSEADKEHTHEPEPSLGGEGPPLFVGLRPNMTNEEFDQWMRQRWREAHAIPNSDEEDRPAPTMHFRHVAGRIRPPGSAVPDS